MAYGALATRIKSEFSEGKIIDLPVADNVKIVKGALVNIDANGYANNPSDAINEYFAGAAFETVDNTETGHAAGGKRIRVYQTGVHPFKNGTGITVAMLMKDAYLDLTKDNGTVNNVSGGSTAYEIVGKIIDVTDDYVFVKIDSAIGNISTANPG